ncbi:hypothetical protein SteCoe_1088 [Stentor coeruleus]|uniref:Ribosomal protein S9 n=1 Tax=Stentor coeruleus TaxID=5963 RepID=A0A1R2D2J8_9CILI|nr:hypothetical protein SteCoe_1088 [Stentor coeruleus]
MSFLRIRLLRPFGDFHQIFAKKPVFPEEDVNPKLALENFQKINKLRKQRFWLFIEKERIERKIKKKFMNVKEGIELTEPPEIIKDEKYYEERSLIPGDDPISKIFDVDRETLLPYGMGYDDVIKETKEKRMAEVSQDKIRDIWMKLGFTSTLDVLSIDTSIDFSESIEKINRKIYTSRHKQDPKPYDGIQYEDNPRTQTHSVNEPEFFSQSEQEESDDYAKCLKMAKEKYKSKVFENQNFIIEDNGNKAYVDESSTDDYLKKKPHFPKKFYSDPYNSPYLIQKIKYKENRHGKKHIINAAKSAYEVYKNKNEKIFKDFCPVDYLKKADFEYNLRIRHGLAPSFLDVITEAEKIIAQNPILKKVSKKDDYQRNMHFVPRYLDKTLTPDDYIWSFFPNKNKATYPGYVTGKYDYREDDKTLTEIHDMAEMTKSRGFTPDSQDMSLKALSIIKNDPYHMHYLNNHIMYWLDCMKETVEGKNNEGEAKAAPMIPWEYIPMPDLRNLRAQRNKNDQANSEGYIVSYGKRKRAYAWAYLRPGTGQITINNTSLIKYCPDFVSRERIIRPFRVTRLSGMYDAKLFVKGGGFMGQSQALQMAIARVIGKFYPGALEVMHEHSLMTRDPRQVERKKTSKHKARKSYAYVKR